MAFYALRISVRIAETLGMTDLFHIHNKIHIFESFSDESVSNHLTLLVICQKMTFLVPTLGEELWSLVKVNTVQQDLAFQNEIYNCSICNNEIDFPFENEIQN